MVYFFQRWNPSKFLTREDAAGGKRSLARVAEARMRSELERASSPITTPVHGEDASEYLTDYTLLP